MNSLMNKFGSGRGRASRLLFRVFWPPPYTGKCMGLAAARTFLRQIRFLLPLLGVVGLCVLAPAGRAQTVIASSAAPIAMTEPPTEKPSQPNPLYSRPAERMKLRAYWFDAYGPYPIVGAALIAGVNQAENTPPEWGQGGGAFGKRYGSNLAIAAVTTTTRYGLAEAFREDTLYYRCECKGIFRRLEHVMISTVTARHGEDGHRQLSFPAIVAPYAGTMTAVYAWYPARYGAKDALRMGNYNLLAFAGENFALEFIYGGPHTLFSRLHRPAFSGTDTSSASNH
jgi:hypothetical protein